VQVDLDLAQVRAFVTAAHCGHFGQAAAELGMTQQALSKRIARLEARLGVLLFDRGHHQTRLTDDGARFLEPATRALTAGDAAVAVVRGATRPLRVDVFGHLYGPHRTLRQVAGGVDIEWGTGRDLPSVITSLLRGEIDAGFGRVHPTGVAGEDALRHRLVRMEPVDVVVSVDHPLADADEVRPAELRDGVLWAPATLTKLDFLRRFADRFEVATESGVNLGIEHLVADLRANRRRFALFPADAPLPVDAGVQMIPLVDPTPLYAWSLIWRDDTPAIDGLLGALAEVGGRSRWLEYDQSRDWLPEPDPART
jgi:DNA-binding transcriptional LysR family regulator